MIELLLNTPKIAWDFIMLLNCHPEVRDGVVLAAILPVDGGPLHQGLAARPAPRPAQAQRLVEVEQGLVRPALQPQDLGAVVVAGRPVRRRLDRLRQQRVRVRHHSGLARVDPFHLQ